MTQTTGASFTIGGMVASQCGVPLILSGGANSMRVNQFLSAAQCLGDILSRADYQTAYLGGASIEFAGKGAFYKTHGYGSVQGLEELRPDLEDPKYLAEWGLQDDTLFDLARRKINTLTQQDAPYALTMLTLDTHHPNGHADTNKLCRDAPYQDGDNPMLNSVKCVDTLANAFIQDVLEGPEGDNTVIVVMSDHLAMRNAASQQLEAGPRRNLFFILDGTAQGAQIDRPSTTMDVAPTVLSVLGFDLPRLGFGVDLRRVQPSLPEEMGVGADEASVLDRYVLGFQSLYNRLWAYPDISDGLYTNLEKGEMQLGENAYGIPALLTFDDTHAVNSTMLGDSLSDESLIETVINLPDATPLLWIDECRALQSLTADRVKLKRAETCIAHGKHGRGLTVDPLFNSKFIPTSQLQEYLDAEGDAFLASYEQTKLEEMGILKGELPFRLSIPSIGNKGRGVLIQSAGFDAGASYIRRQTNGGLTAGEDWILKRGLTLSGIDASGRATTLAIIDQCRDDFSASDSPRWLNIIKETLDQFSAHVVTVHDTAFCGNGSAIFEGPLAGLDLPKLMTSEARQPYIGVINHNGRVFEFLNTTFAKLRVLLDPKNGDLADFSQIAFNAPSKPELNIQLQPELVAEVLDSAAGCEVPPNQRPNSVNGKLPLNAVLLGEEMDAGIQFVDGWWPTEKEGRWSGQKSSSVNITIPNVDGLLELVLGVVAYSNNDQTLRIWHGGNLLGGQHLSGNKSLAFDVSGLPREEQINLRIETDGAQVACPLSTLGGTDARRLNFMLNSVELRRRDTRFEAIVHPTPFEKLGFGTCAAPSRLGFENRARTVLRADQVLDVSSAEESGQISFGSGWWGPESFGRWIGSDTAEFELILPEEIDQVFLEVETVAYAKSLVEVEIVFEGKTLVSTQAGVGHPIILNVSSLPRRTPIRLAFRVFDADPRFPAINGTSNDPRFLRVMVQSLLLTSGPETQFGGAIAHAGGRLNGVALTNSFDALQANSAKFETYEIDFSWTSDGDLVCIHDWIESLTSRFDLPMSRADFMSELSATRDRPRNCDLDGLAGWMRAHPDKRVVTDMKSSPLKAHELIESRHPDILGQFIPQAYEPEEIPALKALGFKDVIWTLYRFPRDVQRIVEHAIIQQPVAITMPEQWAVEGDLVDIRNQTGLPILVHTINDIETAGCLKTLGAAAIYSDDLGAEDFSTASGFECALGT